ncbi:MAG: hypothetical protein IJC39_05595, partial [Firmicutes bacterium]|nr:hypothetical protein [Bacillota bacterium]
QKRIFMIIFAGALFFSGCSGQSAKLSLNSLGQSQYSAWEREKILYEKISEIGGIKETAVSVNGNTALIGLKLSPGAKEREETIKELARSAALSADAQLISAAVTCNEELFRRIKRLQSG